MPPHRRLHWFAFVAWVLSTRGVAQVPAELGIQPPEQAMAILSEGAEREWAADHPAVKAYLAARGVASPAELPEVECATYESLLEGLEVQALESVMASEMAGAAKRDLLSRVLSTRDGLVASTAAVIAIRTGEDSLGGLLASRIGAWTPEHQTNALSAVPSFGDSSVWRPAARVVLDDPAAGASPRRSAVRLAATILVGSGGRADSRRIERAVELFPEESFLWLIASRDTPSTQLVEAAERLWPAPSTTPELRAAAGVYLSRQSGDWRGSDDEILALATEAMEDIGDYRGPVDLNSAAQGRAQRMAELRRAQRMVAVLGELPGGLLQEHFDALYALTHGSVGEGVLWVLCEKTPGSLIERVRADSRTDEQVLRCLFLLAHAHPEFRAEALDLLSSDVVDRLTQAAAWNGIGQLSSATQLVVPRSPR